jgi:hypothetical protein
VTWIALIVSKLEQFEKETTYKEDNKLMVTAAFAANMEDVEC